MIRSDLWQRALLAIGWIAISAPSSAQAFEYDECDGEEVIWLSNSQPLRISTTSFPANGIADQTIRSAISKWNAVAGSSFSFTAVPDPDATRDPSNAMNELYLDAIVDPSVITMTFIRSTCRPGVEARLNEVDMAFNSNVEWSMEPYSYDNPVGAPYNFEGAVLHEVGHALGLLHEDARQATMNTFYPYGGPLGSAKEWDPFGDDRRADTFLYPSGQNEIDLAASALTRTTLGSSDLVSSPTTAARGASVTIEYTITNLSFRAQTLDVGFYLSTDAEIRASDRLLATTTTPVPAPVGSTRTRTQVVVIPANTRPGTYFLGFLLDPNGVLAESDEENNSQVLPRRVRITIP